MLLLKSKFDSLFVIIVILRCPNPNDHSVELLQNGVSTSSRFSFRMFIFTANSSKLYLHCSVHLCLLSSNRCSSVSLKYAKVYKSAIYQTPLIKHLKGSSDAHFPQVDMILYGLNEKSITYFG